MKVYWQVAKVTGNIYITGTIPTPTLVRCQVGSNEYKCLHACNLNFRKCVYFQEHKFTSCNKVWIFLKGTLLKKMCIFGEIKT